jgi:hypothetical protein
LIFDEAFSHSTSTRVFLNIVDPGIYQLAVSPSESADVFKSRSFAVLPNRVADLGVMGVEVTPRPAQIRFRANAPAPLAAGAPGTVSVGRFHMNCWQRNVSALPQLEAKNPALYQRHKDNTARIVSLWSNVGVSPGRPSRQP